MNRQIIRRSAQAGFTIIELIVVIVILGVLAATALPKFIDLGGDAKAAAISGVAGAAGSAMALNYSGCLVTNHVVTTNKCVKIEDCDDVTNILQGGTPTDYAITGAPAAGAAVGTTFTCTVTKQLNGSADPGVTAVTFTGTRAGN